MRNWFKDRFDEPTSWLAFGGFLQFIGILTKSDEATIVAQTVADSAEPLASGDYVTAAINIGTALALAFGFAKQEKAR